MTAIPAGDAARTPRLVLDPSEPVATAIERLHAAGVPGAPVVAADGRLRGSFDGQPAGDGAAERPLEDHALDPVAIAADDSLDVALGTLADRHRAWAPVERDGRLVGVLSARDVLAAYRQAVAGNVRRIEQDGRGGAMLTADLGDESALLGRTLAQADWPAGSVLVSVERHGEVVVPRGDLVFAPGDRVTAFTTPAARAAVAALLASTRPAPPDVIVPA